MFGQKTFKYRPHDVILVSQMAIREVVVTVIVLNDDDDEVRTLGNIYNGIANL